MEGEAGTADRLRRLLVLLVLAGELGLLAELLLLEHIESAWQWAPIVILAGGVPLTLWLALRPNARAVQVVGVVGVATIATGLLGLYLHYAGNRAFELESDPALRGWALFRASITGATPALAPGSLAQLGLAMLLAVYRHPARRSPLQPLNPEEGRR